MRFPRWQLFDFPAWKFPSTPENILDNEKWGNFLVDFSLKIFHAKTFGEKNNVSIRELNEDVLEYSAFRLCDWKQCDKQQMHLNSNDVERFLWQVVQLHCYSTWWTTVTTSSLVVSVSDHAFVLFCLAENVFVVVSCLHCDFFFFFQKKFTPKFVSLPAQPIIPLNPSAIQLH